MVRQVCVTWVREKGGMWQWGVQRSGAPHVHAHALYLPVLAAARRSGERAIAVLLSCELRAERLLRHEAWCVEEEVLIPVMKKKYCCGMGRAWPLVIDMQCRAGQGNQKQARSQGCTCRTLR